MVGTVEEGDFGMMKLKAGLIVSMMTVSMDAFVQVTPFFQPMVIYSGSLNIAYSQITGSSQMRNISIL